MRCFENSAGVIMCTGKNKDKTRKSNNARGGTKKSVESLCYILRTAHIPGLYIIRFATSPLRPYLRYVVPDCPPPPRPTGTVQGYNIIPKGRWSSCTARYWYSITVPESVALALALALARAPAFLRTRCPSLSESRTEKPRVS